MNSQLQSIHDFIQQNAYLTADEKATLLKLVKKVDSDLTISEFKLERTEKVKRTTGILLEETIAELEQKRQAVEAHNRELEIETALEKVRSRTMAMQHSDELGVVVKLLYQELRGLGLANEHSDVEICIIEEDTGMATIWQTDLNLTGKANHLIMPFKEFPLLKKEYSTWKKTKHNNRKKLFIVNEYTGKTLTQFIQFLSKLDGWGKVVQSFRNNEISNWITNNAYFNYGMLTYQSEQRLSVEGKSILKRLCGVFEQTYTRFLDLQKAEEQAREAQIEASLERIRSQSMAMRESHELSEIAMTLSNEMRALGFPRLFEVGYIKWDEEDQLQKGWLTDFEGKNMEPFKLPLRGDKVLNERYRNWKKQSPLLYQKIGSKALYDHVQFCLPTVGSEHVKQQVDKHFSDPTHFYHSFFKEGALCLISQTALTSSQESLLIRYRKVFEQSYTRFLDIQKAEAQTREVQIEIAMERVRARSMAMHKSEELIETATLLYRELADLGIPPFSTGFVLVDEKNSKQEVWFSAPGGAGYMDRFFLPLTGDSVLDERYRNWKNKVPIYHERVEGKRLTEHLKFVSSFFGTPEAEEQAQKFPEAIVFYCSYFKEGYLHILTEDILNSEQESLMKRFTQVFAMTYTRFLDLKKAEIRTKESLKQSSLDRLRAKIASMRTAIDLQQIIPSIWNELDILGVPFIRCGVFIINEAYQKINTYLSAPDGKALAAFELAYDTNDIAKNVVCNWKKNKIYQTSWSKMEFVTFMTDLVDKGLLKDPMSYQGAETPPVSLHLNFVPFEQGMLYVGNTMPLKENEIEIIQSLANAFSTAYARYEDFKKLEAAKEQVENALVDLKQTQSQLIQSEKMASLGELTAGIAHEIQNPLNFVNNFSEVSMELLEEMLEELKNGEIEEVNELASDVIKNLEKINHHGKRADGIVKGMLQHSRTSSGAKEPTHLNTFADEYLRLAYHGLRAKDKSFNASIQTHFDESIGNIDIISQDIGRVLLNLITNAFYAVTTKKKQQPSDYEPTVTVTTKKIGSSISISVKDNGNGIPKSILDKIFQPFFTTKPTGQGTGLGLSLSYDIVKAHGGEITVESTENIGTEFILTLPN